MQFITKFDIFSNYTIRQWFDKWGDTDILKLSNIFNLLSVYNNPKSYQSQHVVTFMKGFVRYIAKYILYGDTWV